ncbi:MAG: hypothetical protein IKZ56_02160 [Bacteroidales bacterium]|nr:hypothetical protein [Bacteroidales bacterium]
MTSFIYSLFPATPQNPARSVEQNPKMWRGEITHFPLMSGFGRRPRHGVCRDGTRHHPNFLYVMPLCMGLVIRDLGR